MKHPKLTKQTYAIAAFCMIDLVTTLWLLTHQSALEANPFMSQFLAQGVFGLVVAKIAFTVVPLAFLEWARHRSPRMVQRALTVTVVAYVSMYALGVVHANIAYANGGGKNDRAESRPYSEAELASFRHPKDFKRPVPLIREPQPSGRKPAKKGTVSKLGTRKFVKVLPGAVLVDKPLSQLAAVPIPVRQVTAGAE